MAELLHNTHQEGHAWGDMAVICRYYSEMDAYSVALARKRLPYRVRKSSGDFRPLEDVIKVMPMHASKELEFPMLAALGKCLLRKRTSETRLFYVSLNKSMSILLITLDVK